MILTECQTKVRVVPEVIGILYVTAINLHVKCKKGVAPMGAAIAHSGQQADKETQPHLAKKKVQFHHDNAPAYSSRIVIAKLHELRYELLLHPPYSPGLALFLFSSMKTWLRRKIQLKRGGYRRYRSVF